MNWMNECKLNLHHHRCRWQKYKKETIRPKLPNLGLLRNCARQVHSLLPSHFYNCHHRSSQICSVLYPNYQQGFCEDAKRIHTNRIERNIKRRETAVKLLFLFGATHLYIYVYMYIYVYIYICIVCVCVCVCEFKLQIYSYGMPAELQKSSD